MTHVHWNMKREWEKNKNKNTMVDPGFEPGASWYYASVLTSVPVLASNSCRKIWLFIYACGIDRSGIKHVLAEPLGVTGWEIWGQFLHVQNILYLKSHFFFLKVFFNILI